MATLVKVKVRYRCSKYFKTMTDYEEIVEMPSNWAYNHGQIQDFIAKKLNVDKHEVGLQ